MNDHPEKDSFELDRRSFLGAVGGGIAVVCAVEPDTADGQEPARSQTTGRSTRSPRQLAAWLHIAPDGSVTAFTGKVEIGQNIRTSLAQAVAEELRVPFAQVRMVTGDTAQCPFDIGTFGSLTTSANAPLLRRAAATARRLLMERAAKELREEPNSLVAENGQVIHRASNRTLSYGTLAAGEELVADRVDGIPLTPAKDWKVAGQPIAKVDGRAFVTGAHRYASDIRPPGMWHGKVLRPPGQRATLVSVDTRDAEAIPGVVVVRDADFVGVAAPDEPTASRALAAIRAEWKPGPESCTHKVLPTYLKSRANGYRSLSAQSRQAPATDEVVLERTFTAAYIAHVPLEPRAAVAEWKDGKLTVWTGSQRPFAVRTDLARTFALKEEQVHVRVPDTGSGYGGKHIPDADIEAARLAKACGHPVRRCWTREEEMTLAYARPAGVVEAAVRAAKSGKLTAWEFHNINSGNAGLACPYRVDRPISAFHPSDSPLRQGSYRALASTFNHFARESLINELAVQIGMDPLAFRLANLDDDRLIAVLKAAAERFGWQAWKPGPDRGIGIAGGHDKGGCIATCAEVALDKSSGRMRVVRVAAAFEPGAVVNPDGMTNQVQGCLMMGLGGALFEELTFQNGSVTSNRLAKYRVPRFSDVPKIDVVLVDRKDLPSAGGGEIPIVAIAPAIAAAVFQATGQNLRSLPMRPEGWKF